MIEKIYDLRDKRRAKIYLYRQQRSLCFCCRRTMWNNHSKIQARSGRDDAYSLEHVIPRALGGLDLLWNTAVSHRSCNTERGARLPTDQEMTLLLEIHGPEAVRRMLALTVSRTPHLACLWDRFRTAEKACTFAPEHNMR